MKRILIALLVVLMIIAYSPPSLAIVVDGVKSPGEWDEGWAFGQDRNASHPAPVFPYGDRGEVEQGHGTGIINMVDPPDDSGPDYDETMATVGPFKSGSDLGKFYAHYDASLDTLYGLSINYGSIGDLDGDNDIGEQCNDNGDCLGDPGPNGLLGIGTGETFTLKYLQGSAELRIIIGQNNNWQAGLLNLDYEDVDIVWTSEQPDGTDPEACIEVSISNASKYFNFAFGADPIILDVTAGGIMDIPGEDTARLTFFIPPCGKLGDYVWWDKDQDGIQDAGENGIANVKVDLYYHGTDTLVGSTTTNSNGRYLFECVDSMSCYDIVLNPSNFNAGGPLSDPNLTASPANVGNDATDSDGINNRIDNRCLTPDNPVDLTNDFGFYVPPRVPGLTPFGLFVMAGLLGILGIIGIRMKR